MRFVIVAFLLCMFSLLTAQVTWSGKVLDASSGEPIEFALISLHNKDSAVIVSTTSLVDGSFKIQAKKEQVAFLEIQFLGYERLKQELTNIYDLGTISLKPSTTLLNEVQITSQSLSSFQKIDRQNYKTSQFANATGGTAFDLIKNLPAISTNAEGDISLRGSQGFILMVNGKIMNVDPKLILNQMSAASIEEIEVITTPSAKYDPDGKGGIIQIKSKQINTDGYSISASVNIGTPAIQNYDNKAGQQRYGADVTYNLRKKKMDLLVGFDYLRDDRSGRRLGYVNTIVNKVLTEFPSTGERSFDQKNYSFRLSNNYQFNKQHSVNGSLYLGSKDQARTADIFYNPQQRILVTNPLNATQYYESWLKSDNLYANGQVLNQVSVYNENLRVRNATFLLGSFDYKYSHTNGMNFKLSNLYEQSQLGGPTDNFNYNNLEKQKLYQYQYNDNDNPLTGFRTQLDIDKKWKTLTVETGYQYRYTSHPGDFTYQNLNLLTNKLEIVPSFTNRIDLTRNIHSIYTQLSQKKGKLNITGGLRLESTNRLVSLQQPNESYAFDTINIFPNAALNYAANDVFSFKMGYSKRIQRNTTSMLTPFPEREHSETLEQGDARLIPEYVDNYEIGVQAIFPKVNLFSTFYHRSIQNTINRVNNIYNDSILNRIYTNAGNISINGLEFGANLTLGKRAKLYLGTNLYNYAIEGILFGEKINQSNFQYSINTNIDVSLPKNYSAQFAINYLSERVTAQGIDSKFYLPSFTLTKKINDKFNVIFNWINIDLGLLQTNEQSIATWQTNFYTTTNYVHEVDILKLVVAYKLNQVSKTNKFKNSEFGAQEF